MRDQAILTDTNEEKENCPIQKTWVKNFHSPDFSSIMFEKKIDKAYFVILHVNWFILQVVSSSRFKVDSSSTSSSRFILQSKQALQNLKLSHLYYNEICI